MKRWLVGGVIAAIVVAYVAGYWPQRQRRVAREGEIAVLEAQVTELESTRRAARLLGDLLHLSETVAAMDYGRARDLSSAFFDNAAAEAGRSADDGTRSALEAIVKQRDAVTAALAQGNQSILVPLQQVQFQLRESLGYPVPPSVPPSPPGPSPR